MKFVMQDVAVSVAYVVVWSTCAVYDVLFFFAKTKVTCRETSRFAASRADKPRKTWGNPLSATLFCNLPNITRPHRD